MEFSTFADQHQLQQQQDNHQRQSYYLSDNHHSHVQVHDQSNPPSYREYYHYEHHHHHYPPQQYQPQSLPAENGDYSYTHNGYQRHYYHHRTQPPSPPLPPENGDYNSYYSQYGYAKETTHFGYSSAEIHADLIPSAAAAVAKLDEMSAVIDIARRTVVRLYGGTQTLPGHLASRLPHGGSSQSHPHPPVNQPPLIGTGRGKSYHHISVKGGASSGHHVTLDCLASSSLGWGRSQPHSNSALKLRSLSSTKPKKVAVATLNGGKKAWLCDLCKAECNSKEIFEQHISGKKHKKNLERLEGEMKIVDKGPSSIMTIEQKPPLPESEGRTEMDMETDQTVTGNVAYENLVPVEPLQHGASEILPEVGNTDRRTAPLEAGINQHRSRSNGKNTNKRNKKNKQMAGGVVKRPMKGGPQKPKMVLAFICELCNIRCDTQEVMNKHRAGKKHIVNAKMKYQGLQDLCPPYASLSSSSFYQPWDQSLPLGENQQAMCDPHTTYHPQPQARAL